MIKIIKSTNFYPDYIADTILDIDSKTLKKLSITHIVFDLDNTLVHHGKNEITHEYHRYIKKLTKSGFTVLLGTNTRRDITKLAAQLGTESVQASGISFKPFGSFYERVMDATDTTPEHIAMVGDHVINDVFGANLAGLTTILVNALHNKPNVLYQWYQRIVMKHASGS